MVNLPSIHVKRAACVTEKPRQPKRPGKDAKAPHPPQLRPHTLGRDHPLATATRALLQNPLKAHEPRTGNVPYCLPSTTHPSSKF